jgi:hypothetical protein
MGVRYHPTEPGTHNCEIQIGPALCRNVSLSGKGVADPLGTLVRVCTFAQSRVRVTISYDLGGSRDSVETDLSAFEVPRINCLDTYVPVGATNVGIHAAYSTGSEADPWATIFRESFPEPLEKCYRVTETMSEEIVCGENSPCPPY